MKFQGEIKEAQFDKKHRVLTYWSERNVTTPVNCDTLAMAKLIVAKSGITQELKAV